VRYIQHQKRGTKRRNPDRNHDALEDWHALPRMAGRLRTGKQ
jgi:hypothetical protein